MTSNSVVQTDEKIWKDIISTTRTIQDLAFKADSRKKFLQVLLESDLPVSREDLSVIYKSNDSESPRFVVNCGKETYSKQQTDKQKTFPVDLQSISIIDSLEGDGHHTYYPTEEECTEADFFGYKSVLCIPMHLSHEKNTGVLIAHSKTTEHAYDDLIFPLDILSDSLTFYMKSNGVHHRDVELNELYNTILNDDSFDEIKILEEINFKLKKWFPADDIYIFLVNSFNLDQYLLVTDKNGVDTSFRTKKDSKKILPVAGNTLPLMIKRVEKGKKGGLVLNSVQEIKNNSIEGDCKSWVGIPMQSTAEDVLGFIILQNHKVENAYEKEEILFIEETALMLSVLWIRERDKQRQESLSGFSKAIVTKKYSGDSKLFRHIQTALDAIYGSVPLAIVHKISPSSRDLKVKHCTIENFKLDKELSELLESHIRHTEHEKIKKNPADELTVAHSVLGKLLIAPMRLGQHGIGCFIVPAQKCGQLTASHIDELSDLVAIILDKQNERNRLSLLKKFGEKVSKMSTTDLSVQKVIELAHEYIAEAMYSKNLYIALYKKETNTISFPLILKNGKNWPMKKRTIDKTELGKTEEIILTGTPLLHKTKKKSIDWYDEPNHEEFADDPLASYLGVPIFNSSGVAGVIATYHSTEEYVYSEGDRFFLKMMSHHVSGLFRHLDNTELEEANEKLEEANEKLEEAQEVIVEKEHLLAGALVAQDITHRLNNSLSSLGINISQAREDIKEALNTQRLDHLQKTHDRVLLDAAQVVNNLASEVRLVADPEKQEISVKDIASKLVQQVMIKNKLSSDKISIYQDYPRLDLKVKAPYRNLSNCLYELIENAGSALLSRLEQSILSEGLYLKIVIQKENDFVLIDVIDNGVPIPDDIRDKIFTRGESSKPDTNSGYGLWRTKALAHSIEGTLELLNSNSEIKVFRLKIPVIKCRKSLAFVIEDESSWRNILSRWLKEEGFELETADTLQSALKLFANSETNPQLVLLDISLDPLDSREVEGLSLIEKAKKLGDDVKVILLTGYKDNATLYKDDADLLIEKMKDGNFLTKTNFMKQLQKLEIPSCVDPYNI